MSLCINLMQTVDVPDDEPIVKYDVDAMEYHIWPQGMGRGPVIHVGLTDWTRIVDSAAAALAAATSFRRST